MSDGETITLPVLPLRDIVVFPNMIVRLFVGREKSVKALESVMSSDQRIILATQKDAGIDELALINNIRCRGFSSSSANFKAS